MEKTATRIFSDQLEIILPDFKEKIFKRLYPYQKKTTNFYFEKKWVNSPNIYIPIIDFGFMYNSTPRSVKEVSYLKRGISFSFDYEVQKDLKTIVLKPSIWFSESLIIHDNNGLRFFTLDDLEQEKTISAIVKWLKYGILRVGVFIEP